MHNHALIVGGTRGLGREVAHQFSARGDAVSIIGRRAPAEADGTLRGAKFWAGDVADEAGLPALLDAAVIHGGPVNHLVFIQRFRGEGDRWVGEIATSLTATKSIIEALLPRFAASGDRSIVVVGSMAIDHIVSEQPVGYHVAKAGLRQMAAYYAVALAPRGIRVNCVSPCVLLKEENRDFYAANPSIVETYRRVVPLGRMAKVEDAANVILFFCSPKAGFVTGQHIVVDGGVSLLSQESLARTLTGT